MCSQCWDMLLLLTCKHPCKNCLDYLFFGRCFKHFSNFKSHFNELEQHASPGNTLTQAKTSPVFPIISKVHSPSPPHLTVAEIRMHPKVNEIVQSLLDQAAVLMKLPLLWHMHTGSRLFLSLPFQLCYVSCHKHMYLRLYQVLKLSLRRFLYDSTLKHQLEEMKAE